MARRSRLFIAVGPLLLLALLAGCGANGQNTTGGAIPPASATFQPTVTVIPAQTKTTTLPGKARPTPTPRSSVPLATGPVTLTVNASSYRAGEVITVTLSNESTQPIQFPDHLTDCSVVLLQQQTGAVWQSVDLCKSMIASRIHTLGAGQSLTVQLMASNQWAPGTYRFRLSYYGAPLSAGQLQTVFSPQFQVG